MGPKIEIKTDGTKAKIFIDGTEISKGVCRYSIKHEAGNTPILQIDLIGTNLIIDGDMVPELPDALKPYYERKCD